MMMIIVLVRREVYTLVVLLLDEDYDTMDKRG